MNDKLVKKIIDKSQWEDIAKGYVYDQEKDIYICLFCGEIYEKGVIYRYKDKLLTMDKAVQAHIMKEHGDVFYFLLDLGKKYTGLSQKEAVFLKLLYEEYDNQEISEELNISLSTVRNYKFKMKEKIRQAKVYLSIVKLINKDSVSKEKLISELGDVAVYEKIKDIEKKLSDEIIKDSLNTKKKFNLNFMIPFLGPNKPGIR